MWVKYFNVEPHTVSDGGKDYCFKQNTILEVPEPLAGYLVGKYRNSFVKADGAAVVKQPPRVIKPEEIPFSEYVKPAAVEIEATTPPVEVKRRGRKPNVK